MLCALLEQFNGYCSVMMVYVLRAISQPGWTHNGSSRLKALSVLNIIIAFVWLFFGLDFTLADTAKKSASSAGQNDKGIDFK